MESFIEKQKRWKTYTTALMWCVFVFIFGNAISSVLDVIEAIMSFVSQILNIFDEEEVPTEIINLMSWGSIAKIILFISYGVFIWGITKLKALIPEDGASWKKVRTAFILLLVGAFISWALHFLPVINLLGYFICWLLSVIAFCKQKNAFGKLSKSGQYSRGASEGFNHLKNVADSNLALHTWIPLGTIITLVIIGGSSISNIASSGSLKDLEQSLYSIYAGFALVGIIWGFIMALTILHIFFANIIGWIKVKCGNLVETEVLQENHPNESVQPIVKDSLLGNPAKDEIQAGHIPSVNSATESYLKDIEREQKTSDKSVNKRGKSKLIIGVLILMSVVIGGLFYYFGGNGAPLELPSPQWDKFVVPTRDDVKAYKAPDKKSLMLCMADEQLESETAMSEYCWSDRKSDKEWSVMEWKFGTQDVLPVLEETEEWYKVYVKLDRGWDCHLGKPAIAYIEKSCVKEISPEPITAKILEEKFYGSVINVITSGEMKGLCLINDYSNVEMDDVYLHIGELKDNSLVMYKSSLDMDYIEDEKAVDLTSEIINTTDGEKVKIHKLMFNESKSLFLEDYGLTLLDVRKLTEEETEQLISIEDYKSKNLTAYYSFPEIKWLLEFPIKPVEQ
ncbi:MAG: hypothetical protein IKC18_03035 [Bacteroidaceae bacterium]|nr:hypothetical protein [Bacteroidaceae bacterium]